MLHTITCVRALYQLPIIQTIKTNLSMAQHLVGTKLRSLKFSGTQVFLSKFRRQLGVTCFSAGNLNSKINSNSLRGKN